MNGGSRTITGLSKKLGIRWTLAKVRFGVEAELIGTLVAIAVNSKIVEAKIVVEGIGPEFGTKSGTSEHRAKSVGDSAVGTFTRTVLMRRVRCGRLNTVASVLEEINDFATVAKFATKVEANVLVSNSVGETVTLKPASKEVDRRSLRAEGFTMKGTAVVIGDKAIAKLAVEALIARDASFIIRSLNDEAEVDGDALIALGGMASRVMATSMLVKLGAHTDRALIKGRSYREARDTERMSMEVRHSTRVEMSKAMMPKDSFLVSCHVMNNIDGVRIRT